MDLRKLLLLLACLATTPFSFACSEDDDGPNGTKASGGSSGVMGELDGGTAGLGAGGDGSTALDPQAPPSTAAGMTEWLAAFEAKDWEEQWVCEAEFTEKSEGAAAIHVHGANRVCNNQALADATLDGDAELPVGSAALKYVERGIYVEVKVKAESDAGDGWFWYAPNGEAAGAGLAACTGCHGAAGSDADHPGLGDYVYFQVK